MIIGLLIGLLAAFAQTAQAPPPPPPAPGTVEKLSLGSAGTLIVTAIRTDSAVLISTALDAAAKSKQLTLSSASMNFKLPVTGRATASSITRSLNDQLRSQSKAERAFVAPSALGDRIVLPHVSDLVATIGALAQEIATAHTPVFSVHYQRGREERCVVVRQRDGLDLQLNDSDWETGSSNLRLAVVSIDAFDGKKDSGARRCAVRGEGHREVLIARTADENHLGIVMETDGVGLRIRGQAHEEGSTYVVNNTPITDRLNGDFKFGPVVDGWRVEWFRTIDECRDRPSVAADYDVAMLRPDHPVSTAIASGITLTAAKVFDVATLRRMLADTANQLAAISGFSAAPIIGALTNVQGVTRDTSFLSVQAATTPTPSVANTNTVGATANGSTVVTTAGAPGSTTTTVTLQCPDGTVPSIGSGNTGGCATIAANVQPVKSSQDTLTSTSATTAAGQTQATSGTTTSQQGSVTTTTPSATAAIPAAPASTAFSAPGPVGLASSDILAEQVQLNAEITTLRLLLQGALSDQYLLKNSVAVASRQQTTLGFSVTLDPPRQFRHAVAEIRIIVAPRPGQDPISIMNLLPAEKTYNVATITSRQDSFGAGVAVQPISIGASTGRAKDRLYLAKDTDTLAMQFPAPTVASLRKPFPQRLHDYFKSVADFTGLGACATIPEDEREIGDNAVVFGWQFRPVLGAEFVKGGRRQVFAQLALPTEIGTQYAPTILVQTRWRAYDPKRQVVGEVFTDSCSEAPDISSVAALSRAAVNDMTVTDIGGGVVTMRAVGDFFSSDVSVLAGQKAFAPAAFDGRGIDLTASAFDLLTAGKLMLVGQSGRRIGFGIPTNLRGDAPDACGIAKADVIAWPFPDGNSRVRATITMGRRYALEPGKDGEPHPLIVAGDRVFGVRERPFSSGSCQANPNGGGECTYQFIAPTADLRNAQTALVRDLAWDQMSATPTVQFQPSFSSVSAAGSEAGRTIYALSGFDLWALKLCSPAPVTPCLRVLADLAELNAANASLTVLSPNLAKLSVATAAAKDAKALRLLLDTGDAALNTIDWTLNVPKDKPPALASAPPFMRVGDSGKVTYSGSDDLANVDNVMFGSIVITKRYVAADKALELIVPLDVTKTAGHKEFTATLKPGKEQKDPPTKQLPLEVVGR